MGDETVWHAVASADSDDATSGFEPDPPLWQEAPCGPAVNGIVRLLPPRVSKRGAGSDLSGNPHPLPWTLRPEDS